MSRVRKITNSLNLDKWKNQIFETQIEPVACIVSYTVFAKLMSKSIKWIQTDTHILNKEEGVF